MAGIRWSVVVPAHNCAHYLGEALGQVVEQLRGRDDVEVVVVDDASTDDPESVVASFGWDRLRYVRNETNLGAIPTFNRAKSLAQGELVHLLHGDDAVLPGFYAAIERGMDDEQVVAAFSRTRYIDDDGVPTGVVTRRMREGSGRWAGAVESLAVANRIPPPSIVVRRSAYEQVGDYRTTLPHAADWDMWVRLAVHGPVHYVDDVLACYRQHSGSDTASRVRSGENLRERVHVIRQISAVVPPARRRTALRRAYAHSSVFALRTAARLARGGDWSGAAHQGAGALRCAGLAVGATVRPARP